MPGNGKRELLTFSLALDLLQVLAVPWLDIDDAVVELLRVSQSYPLILLVSLTHDN